MFDTVSELVVSTVKFGYLSVSVVVVEGSKLPLTDSTRPYTSYKTYIVDVVRPMNPRFVVNIRRRFACQPNV